MGIFFLSEALVQQATFGTTPSSLILSYLSHGITTKVLLINFIDDCGAEKFQWGVVD